jgi:hypothetical protein
MWYNRSAYLLKFQELSAVSGIGLARSFIQTIICILISDIATSIQFSKYGLIWQQLSPKEIILKTK